MLSVVQKRMKSQDIKFSVDTTAKDLIEKKGTDLNYGARKLKRTIQEKIENSIAEEIINGNLKNEDKIIFDVENGKIIYKIVQHVL